MADEKKLVIIPAYNEEACIAATVREIREKAPGFEVLVVNDASTDRTGEILRQEHIPHVTLPVNLGIGGAVQTGYRYAAAHGYDAAVQLDGDGQHDPEDLPRLYEALVSENADLAIGSRFIEKEGFQSSAARRAGIRFFTFWIRLMTGRTIKDPTSGYRMAGRRALLAFAEDYAQDYPEPESTAGLLCMGGKVTEIPVRMRPRAGGESSIGMRQAFYYMIKVSLAILIECIRKRGKTL